MNRKELADIVAREANLTTAQGEAAVTAALDGIVAAVGAQGRVALTGFGTFELRHRAARSGRNPQTGEVIEIAATHAPAFKPATAFKRAVSDR